jgi:SAM-dependent methyltransferase
MSKSARDWASFWDQPHSIYVNKRHSDVHYRDIAAGIVALLPKREARVLDYGCGEAVHADLVANAAAELVLCDVAPSVRAHLVRRFGENPKIRVLAPEEIERLPAQSFDLVIANSLVQYVSSAQLDSLLVVWRRLLAPGGTLTLADVVPPHVGPLNDAVALALYAAKNGFFLAAIVGTVRTFFSPYRRVRQQLGISRYSEDEFLQKLTASGFAGVRLPFNLEHNAARMTFRASPNP